MSRDSGSILALLSRLLRGTGMDGNDALQRLALAVRYLTLGYRLAATVRAALAQGRVVEGYLPCRAPRSRRARMAPASEVNSPSRCLARSQRTRTSC